MYYKRRSIQKAKKEKDVHEKTNILLKYSSLILAALGLFVPAFYLLGLRFYEGMLSAYGIERGSLALDTADVYVYGYYAIGHMFSDFISFYGEIISNEILLALVVVLFLVIYSVFKYEEKLNFPKYDHSKSEVGKTFKWIFLLVYVPLAALSVIVVLGLFWILVPNWAYKKGKDIQSPAIRDYNVQSCYIKEDNWSNCTQILDENGTKVFEGLLIAINGNKVAFYKKNGSQVIILKADQRLHREKSLDMNATK